MPHNTMAHKNKYHGPPQIVLLQLGLGLAFSSLGLLNNRPKPKARISSGLSLA